MGSESRKVTTSVVMVEWWRYNEPTHSDRNAFLWHQIVLSLLYEHVLAQDETVICSRKLANWFCRSEDFKLFEELVDCGGISILKRPIERYPEDQLKDLARVCPILARADHLKKHSVNNDGTPIAFNKKQEIFHLRLEALLKAHPKTHRHAGVLSTTDLRSNIMDEFSDLFRNVLEDAKYRRWLSSKFKAISSRMIDDFRLYIDEPERAVRRVADLGRSVPTGLGSEFSTALAVLVSSTYAPRESRAMQVLIESVFSRPYCRTEIAHGRYGRKIPNLPIPDVTAMLGATTIQIGRVDVIPIGLPEPQPGFGAVINAVRASPSCKRLRNEMANLGGERHFESLVNAWHAVAEEMASALTTTPARKASVAASMFGLGADVITEIIVECGEAVAVGRSTTMTSMLADSAKATVAALAKQAIRKPGRAALAERERQILAAQFDDAVKFSCEDHPIAN